MKIRLALLSAESFTTKKRSDKVSQHYFHDIADCTDRVGRFLFIPPRNYPVTQSSEQTKKEKLANDQSEKNQAHSITTHFST